MPRIPGSIKSTGQILNGGNHILHSVSAQSRELIRISDIIRQHLHEECAVGALKNKELTLITPRATFATTLRYRQRNLISALKRAGLDVETLKIKVRPVVEPEIPQPERRYLSPATARYLKQSADNIEDKALRAAINRLSSHTRGDSAPE